MTQKSYANSILTRNEILSSIARFVVKGIRTSSIIPYNNQVICTQSRFIWLAIDRNEIFMLITSYVTNTKSWFAIFQSIIASYCFALLIFNLELNSVSETSVITLIPKAIGTS